jgi:hypothetical protein
VTAISLDQLPMLAGGCAGKAWMGEMYRPLLSCSTDSDPRAFGIDHVRRNDQNRLERANSRVSKGLRLASLAAQDGRVWELWEAGGSEPCGAASTALAWIFSPCRYNHLFKIKPSSHLAVARRIFSHTYLTLRGRTVQDENSMLLPSF